MSYQVDPNDMNNGFIVGFLQETTYGFISSSATKGPVARPIDLIKLNHDIEQAVQGIGNVQHDTELAATMKTALTVLMLMNVARGNPMVTQMPMTVAQAWHYVFDVPDQYVNNFTTKETFWAELQSKFPNDFFLDSEGQLIEPLYVSYPPETADWSRPDAPLIPGALAPKMHDEVQPGFSNAISASSPLVVDLSASHTGITLTTWNASSTETYFDLNDNDFAVQTAWVSGDTGLLARDLNSDGVIESSAELFGSPTVDGFAKLAVLDSNHDLRIDNNDTGWSTLVVWTDTNGDAISQNGELHSLTSLGIESIDLAGVSSSTSTISGNPISHTSTIRFTSGATAAIADAWFVHDNTNSYYVGETTLDTDVFYLPSLRGYGTLPDLWIAMSQDSDLKDLVEGFASGFTLESFADASSLNADITSILYQWAEISGIDPEGRGAYIDGQHLAFLEKFLGTTFVQVAFGSPNPMPDAAHSLELAYQQAFDMVSAHLLLQIGANSLFANTVTYDAASGLLSGDMTLSEAAVADLINIAPSPGQENLDFWEAVGRFIENTRGTSNLTNDELTWLDDAVSATDSTLGWDDVVYLTQPDSTTTTNSIYASSTDTSLTGTAVNDAITAYGSNAITIHGNGGNDTINGSSAADVLYGDYGRDTIWAGDGNDQLYGGINNDVLHGDAGNDTLDGGDGGNFLYGGAGDDTYVNSGSDDYISEENHGGADTITLASGITLSDLSFGRVQSDQFGNYNDLLIKIDGGGSIQIFNQLNPSNTGYHIETILFSDSSTLNLSTITNPELFMNNGGASFATSSASDLVIHGGSGNDNVYASSMTGKLTFDGGSGNDYVSSGNNSDVFIASPGFDTISDSGGSDTIVIPDGYSLSDVTLFHVGTSYDLIVNVAELGEIKIVQQLLYSSKAIETLHFLSDDSYVTLTGLSVTNIGTTGSDSINAPYANAGPNNIFDGREGNDSITGSSGNDTYIFSAGNDTVWESGGDDTIRVRDHYSPGDVTLAFVQGSYYNDRQLRITDSDGNTLTVYNDTGSTGSRVEHVAFGNDVVWNLSSMEIETHGTSGNDGYLSGHDIGDASSNDTIYGYGGNDVLNGGDGDDLLYGGDGADTLSNSLGHDIIHGDAGNDTMYGSSYNTLYGDADNDTLRNNASSTNAASTLVTMYGGDGTDTLLGGYGSTVMNGGSGADNLTGWSSGIDIFAFDGASAFSAVDTISQFNKTSGDKLDISDILDGHFDPLTQAITDFVQIQTNGSNSELYVDISGSATFGTAQHIASIQGVTGLTDEEALVTAGTLLVAA